MSPTAQSPRLKRRKKANPNEPAVNRVADEHTARVAAAVVGSMHVLRTQADREAIRLALLRNDPASAIAAFPWDVWSRTLDRLVYPRLAETMQHAGEVVAAATVVPVRKYDASQPRDPAGTPTGGQWTGASFRAYHGSPHDITRFDYARIGTGEGFQTYGHGLYFAQTEEVARNYQGMLTDARIADVPETLEGPGGRLATFARVPNEGTGGDSLGITLQLEDGDGEYLEFTPDDISAGKVDALIGRLFPGQSVTFDPSHAGRMYEVVIDADPRTFLDWDAPLSGQHQLVRERLESLGIDADSDSKRGQDAYQRLAREIEGPVGASRTLRDAGILGVRYLDQHSRADLRGTYNYVVFDDSLVRIVNKRKAFQKDFSLRGLFNMLNPRAARIAALQAARMVTRVTEATRWALRQVLADATARGVGLPAQAESLKDILVETAGLDGPRARRLQGFTSRLQAQGVGADSIARRTEQMRDRLIMDRAKTIARHETQDISLAGQVEAWEQAKEANLLPSGQVMEWLTARGERVCPICAPMDGQRVPQGQLFVSDYDGSTHARPPAHVMCRCALALVIDDPAFSL